MLLHRRYLKPGLLFDLTRHLYARDIYACTARERVFMKASQMTISEYAISKALWSADVRQATVLYLFPTDKNVGEFSAARFGPAIEASPYLTNLVVEGGAAARGGLRKRGSDRVSLKRVRDRFIYLRGTKVRPDGQAPQLKSVDADIVLFDELDEIDPRAVPIAEKRVGHSRLKELDYISTPTYVGAGIHAQWMRSDQREWMVRCECCGTWQALTIEQVVTEWDNLDRPVAWNGQDEGRAYVACERCGEELDRSGSGQWVAEHPERDVAGFHLTKLFSGTIDLLEVVLALDTVNETQRRETFNQDLGLPYTPRGGQMTRVVLDQCRRDYAHGAVQGEQTVLGCDVGRVLHIVIRGPADSESGERPQRWAGEVDTFEELSMLMRRYRVQNAVIDALPETHKVREFQAAFPGRVWLAYYSNARDGSRDVQPVRWDPRKRIVLMDRTRSMDAMYAQFYEPVVATLPANARDVPDYYAHLQAPVRIIEERASGERVARYVEEGADHLAHAENYCMAAGLRRVQPRKARSRQG